MRVRILSMAAVLAWNYLIMWAEKSPMHPLAACGCVPCLQSLRLCTRDVPCCTALLWNSVAFLADSSNSALVSAASCCAKSTTGPNQYQPS